MRLMRRVSRRRLLLRNVVVGAAISINVDTGSEGLRCGRPGWRLCPWNIVVSATVAIDIDSGADSHRNARSRLLVNCRPSNLSDMYDRRCRQRDAKLLACDSKTL